MRKEKIAIIAVLVFVFALSNLNEVAEAENLSVITQNEGENSQVVENAVTSGGAVEVPSAGSINTTGSAVTSSGAIKEGEPLPIEVYDTVEKGGISYIVTDIKDGNIYVEVLSVDNDSATIVYIPKEFEYDGMTMTVTSIGEEGFAYLDKLRKVVIGADIENIGKEAFKGAIKLNRLVIKSDMIKSIGKNALKKVNNNLIIEVPKKSLKNYKKLFKNKGIKVKEIRAIKND